MFLYHNIHTKHVEIIILETNDSTEEIIDFSLWFLFINLNAEFYNLLSFLSIFFLIGDFKL